MNTRRFLALWIPIGLAGTAAIFVLYASMQQYERQSANDPQIEFAENAVDYLDQGVSPAVLMSSFSKADMTKTLSIFGIIFDKDGHVLVSSAMKGSTLTAHADSDPFLPPASVFDYVRQHGEDRVTWQTPTGLRFAAVIAPWSVDPAAAAQSSDGTTTSGFFLAARSLRLTEDHESQLGFLCLMGWLGFIIVSVVGVAIGVSIEKRG